MTRVTSTILIAVILMNGTVGIMASSGLQEDIGVQLAPGVSDSVDQSVDKAKSGLNADAGIGETLVSVILSGLLLFKGIIVGVFAAPTMFVNLGFPAWVVAPIAAPLYVIATLEFIFIATGRDPL
jgi:hypothetical protein